MTLKEYVKKRDFKKTPEPRGAKKKKARKPIYVIQKHNARRLHYDLRLEHGGTLKSWAVPKGPSLDPADKRLAVEVEDHPIEYATFEGVIPKGEYGAGKVAIWDRGTWRPSGDVDAGLKKGHLDFEIEGEKLHGKWTLIRLKKKEKGKNNWLLFKRKDQAAKPGSNIAEQDAPPDFVEPQLAQLMVKPPPGDDWLHEVKYDGYRTLCRIYEGEVRLLTRSGLDWTDKYEALVPDIQELPTDNALLDGEIAYVDDDGKTNFHGLQAALKSNNLDRVVYFVFDLLHLNGEDLRDESLIERKAKLEKLLKGIGRSRVVYSSHWTGDGGRVFRQSCLNKMEGIVSKRADAPYTPGRGFSWQKIKCSNRQEVVIGGYTESEASGRPFGALLIGVYDGGKLRYVGRVGTGFSSELLGDLFKKMKKLEAKSSPFDKPPKEKGTVWLKPKLVAEVEYKTISGDGIFRQTSFKGLRLDKSPQDIGLEQPAADASTVKITHPRRIVYPKTKTAKIDVVNYYREVAPLILPFAKDRPLAIFRCQDQAGKNCFFQKHATGRGLKGIRDRPVAYAGKKDTALSVESEEELIRLIQAGTIEIHGWGARFSRIETPDLIVIDLDPESSALWGKVVDTAWSIKEMLDKLGLKSFVKVTGGKGLHIHVPIMPKHKWETVKEFARSLMAVLEGAQPELYTTNMRKSERTNRIFLDYLRNGYGATAILPYCLRARERPTVSLPITWKELDVKLKPNQFELNEVLEIIKKRRDPWPGYFDANQDVDILETLYSP